MGREFIVCKDAGEVSRRGAELFVRMASERAGENQRFSVALSGGSTPKTMFQLLASDEFRAQVPWGQVDLFWGDERCVPPDHADSNYRMTREALLERVPIPKENVYRIPADHQDRDKAAALYQETLRRYFGLGPGQLPRFDLVYLGMGDDGHTASLFPGTKALAQERDFVTKNYVDKFQSYRITLTAPAINNAKHVVFLIAGAGKADRLHEVLEGPSDPDRLPSQLIQPEGGRLVYIVDQAAAAELKGAE